MYRSAPDLRRVVAEWLPTIDPSSRLYDAADNISLVLVPACTADRVQLPKSKATPLLSEAPRWKPIGRLPKVISGEGIWFSVSCPLCKWFRFPFDEPCQVGIARHTADWIGMRKPQP